MWWERQGHLTVQNNKLFIGGYEASKLAREYGTPIYVYNLLRIKSNYIRMQDAIKRAGFKEWGIHYAMKANNNVNILKLLKTLGAGVDTTSPGEVKLARSIGFKEEDIIFTGTSLSNKDLDFLRKSSILVNFDSISSLKRFKGQPLRRIGIRVNTGIGIGRTSKTTTGGALTGSIPVKFGIPAMQEKLRKFFNIVENKGYILDCVHHHVGSDWGGKDIPKYMQALDKLLEVVSYAETFLGYSPGSIDLGGGYGVPHSQLEREFPIYDFFIEVKDKLEEWGFSNKKILVEPGTYIVSDAGVLLVEVNTVEEKNNRIFIGVDAGLNVFNSPALYNYYHEIVIADRVLSEEEIMATVVGNICESGDVFAIDRKIPTVKEGDIIAILNAGAYGHVMANNYNLRPKGKEIVI